MKSISIAFRAPNLIIPISYHHEVQSLLYHLVRKGGGGHWHDSGVAYGSRKYKLFTFSSLRGGKKVLRDHNQILFEKSIYLDVRCVYDSFCESLMIGLKEEANPVLFGKPLAVQWVRESSPVITTGSLQIKMLSPLTVHKTNEQGQSYFFNPLDNEFSAFVSDNFHRKYAAFTGVSPVGGIVITPIRIAAKDKYVTTYKDIRITAWRGEYLLSGRLDYLNFLYYCGLGARNSDGFGMFDPVN